MIFGLIAGDVLRSRLSERERVRFLVKAGLAGLALGTLIHVLGINPIVKRIWTPSWTLFSTGWGVLFLAGCYYIVDVRQSRGWTLPFLVVGANSIAMYVLVHVAVDYVERAFVTHLGRAPFEVFGAVFAPVLLGAATLAVFWLVLFWMYRKRVFVRI
jgi:predicted acyltransferase